jgi:thiol-disulfide isomerase/thioredoxin
MATQDDASMSSDRAAATLQSDGNSPMKPQESRARRIRRAVIELAAALAVLAAVRWWQARSLASGVAPAVHARDLSGASIAMGSAARAPHVLWFFATWCSVCRASEHNVRALAGDRSVILVASESGDDATLRRFVRDRSLEGLVIVNDASGRIARRFGVKAFPTTFAVSADGRVRATDIGYTTELGLRLRRWWAR